MYDRSTADRINGQIAAEANARVTANIMRDHNTRAANREAAQINKRHQLKMDRLEENYRIQKNNVDIVKGTAGNSIAQTQTAIDMIMELTGQSFEEVKDLIYQKTSESKRNKIKAWLKTSPKFEGGLINEARLVLQK